MKFFSRSKLLFILFHFLFRFSTRGVWLCWVELVTSEIPKSYIKKNSKSVYDDLLLLNQKRFVRIHLLHHFTYAHESVGEKISLTLTYFFTFNFHSFKFILLLSLIALKFHLFSRCMAQLFFLNHNLSFYNFPFGENFSNLTRNFFHSNRNFFPSRTTVAEDSSTGTEYWKKVLERNRGITHSNFLFLFYFLYFIRLWCE